MSRALLAVALAIGALACGPRTTHLQPTPAEAIEVQPQDPPVLPDGKAGAICARGTHHPERTVQVYTCAAGLTCCYGCGIEGCDSLCVSATACADDRP